MRLDMHGGWVRHPAATGENTHALKGMGLTVAEGEALAIIGPSGAGKTTLLQALACALPLEQGQLKLDGVDPWALSHRERQRLRGRLFLAPQVPPLPPRQRVVTAVLAGALPTMGAWASLRSWFYPHDIPGAAEALRAFDVEDKLFDRVDRLSGGERQRVGLARAFLSPSRLWLVDEPLSALDPTRAEQALHSLLGHARQQGITVVATLHQVDRALSAFPRVVGLRDGQVAFDLPSSGITEEHLQALYAQHEHERSGPPPAPPTQDPGPQAVVMHCR